MPPYRLRNMDLIAPFLQRPEVTLPNMLTGGEFLRRISFDRMTSQTSLAKGWCDGKIAGEEQACRRSSGKEEILEEDGAGVAGSNRESTIQRRVSPGPSGRATTYHASGQGRSCEDIRRAELRTYWPISPTEETSRILPGVTPYWH